MSTPKLLEREAALGELTAAVSRVRGGQGELALVTGEAGAGKTSVLRAFVDGPARPARVLWGTCDPLATPRPLGPLLDAATSTNSPLAARLALGLPRSAAYAAALDLIDGDGGRGAVVFVVEDAHWADEATLDLLTWLGRRVEARPVLLVVSYRDEEVGLRHPLRVRLGELGAQVRTRTQLSPLSVEGVELLVVRAGAPIDPVALHQITGGNPFFVTEALATGTLDLPESVRGSVLSRAERLPVRARRLLDALSVVPGRIEHWLVERLADPGDAQSADLCVERGLLQDDHRTIAFRHELARVAVASALLPARYRELHGRALAALAAPGAGLADPARLAYHAVEAADVAAVLRYAPEAARQAAALGAHREAAEHLAAALRVAARVEPEQRAGLLLALGMEHTILGESSAAVGCLEQAATIWRQCGDRRRAALAHVLGVSPLVLAGRQPEAEAAASAAVGLLDGVEPCVESTQVEVAVAALHMLARRFAEAEHHSRRAIASAEALGAMEPLADALIAGGIARSMAGDPSGLQQVRRGIAIAEREGYDRLEELGYVQIGSGCGEVRQYAEAMPALHRAIELAEARELVGNRLYATAWLARCELELGHWAAAADLAGEVVRHPRGGGISRIVALVTLGWLRARRGDPDGASVRDEALDLARATGHLQRLWPVIACRAEAAWLTGRLADNVAELAVLDEVANLALRLGYQRASEELGFWQSLAGAAPALGGSTTTPFGSLLVGRWEEAAERWAEIGCPYERAMALSLADDRDALREAHRVLVGLGASPLATAVARRLRRHGVKVTRGGPKLTSQSPAGLTEREVEVLRLLVTGKTNPAIAAALGISPKTAGHHVSHIIAKLGVGNRTEAAVAGQRLGLVSSDLDTEA